MRILITGSEGVIGKILRKGLEAHDLTLLDQEKSNRSRQADICELAQIITHFRDIETVIHLAADKRNYLPWASLVAPNVTGTRNVYEAARQEGVVRVIFASSLNVYLWKEIFNRREKITEKTTTLSQNDYGLTKIIGEAIGLDYHKREGISVVNLRLGSVNLDNKPNRYADGKAKAVDYAHWLSHDDMTRVVKASLGFKGYASVPWCSANKKAFVDFSFPEKILRIRPKDSSESFR
jgi:dTDP-4-dehydrorhamnose reductase